MVVEFEATLEGAWKAMWQVILNPSCPMADENWKTLAEWCRLSNPVDVRISLSQEEEEKR